MDIVTYALLQKQIKGLTSGVKSASVQGTSIVFTMNDGSKQTITFPTPADGISITDVSIDTDKHLICTMSDGTTLDAGEVPNIKGDKGFSPTITENPDNTKDIYKLDITNEDGAFTTPNLKGTGGGLDPDKYYDKTQVDDLIKPLDDAKHTHDNKDTVLDKLGVSADGNLLFDGNEIKGSVEIDDTSTTATDKTWSAKKINDTADEIKQSVTDVDNKFADYDTSTEVDTKITTALADYEKSADVDTKLGDYYKKTETYSNTEIDDKFTDIETNLTTDIKVWVDSEASLGIKTVLYKNNTLTFYKKPNAVADDTADFTIDLPVEQFLDQTKTTFVNQFTWSETLYPNSTDPNLDGEPVLVLAVKGDTTVSYSFVSMNELVKIYKSDTSTSTVTLTIDDAINTISASVNISADTDNQLAVGTDGGLYAKPTDISGKVDKLTDDSIKENQILVDDGNGNIGASGKSISEYIPAWSGTKAEWEAFDKSTLADGAIVNITDDYNENPVQVKAMPDTATEGDVVQYVGATTSDYTNGYFYKYVADETGILSWKNVPVMQSAEINDGSIATDTTWSSEKINDMIPTSLPADGGTADMLNLPYYSGIDILAFASECTMGKTTGLRVRNSSSCPTNYGYEADNNDFFYQVFRLHDSAGWITITGYDIRSNDVFVNTLSDGAWIGWRKINDHGNADTLDGKHSSDFYPTQTELNFSTSCKTYAEENAGINKEFAWRGYAALDAPYNDGDWFFKAYSGERNWIHLIAYDVRSNNTFEVQKGNETWGTWKNTADGGNAATVNSHTVLSNVPANAKFTGIDDNTTTSTTETWSAKKINDSSFAGRIVISFDMANTEETLTATLNQTNGAYLYWASRGGDSAVYEIGMFLFASTSWLKIPIKATDTATTISFSVMGNTLTATRGSAGGFPSAGGVIALGKNI